VRARAAPGDYEQQWASYTLPIPIHMEKTIQSRLMQGGTHVSRRTHARVPPYAILRNLFRFLH
jgi:hypothetical protein